MSTLSEISERESSPAAANTAVAGAAAGAVPQHEALKRPSLINVLFGSHLSIYVNEGIYEILNLVHEGQIG